MSVHEKKKDFKSDLCHFISGNLKWHIEIVHDNRKREFKCDICKKIFSEIKYLKVHISCVHD